MVFSPFALDIIAVPDQSERLQMFIELALATHIVIVVTPTHLLSKGRVVLICEENVLIQEQAPLGRIPGVRVGVSVQVVD